MIEVNESKILLFDTTVEDRVNASEVLSSCFPTSFIENVDSIDGYAQQVKNNNFDIVILDHDITTHQKLIEMLFKLKTEDYEPSVIVLSKNPNSQTLNNLYSFGCHRCIEKDDRWLEELGTAVDSLMRIRRVHEENILLKAKLTEANMLLQERNRRLDEFSATVAHDIRGPLGTVLMRLEYIQDLQDEKFSERTDTLLTRARASIERLVDLVQSTYEYAKLGEKARDMTELDIEQIIHQAFEDLAFDKDIDIQVRIDDLPVVWGNRGLLRRVFLNLISNAVKYNDKASVCLDVGVEGYHSNSLSDYVKFYVKDNGPGIPEEEQKDLFTIFRRGSSSEGRGEGSGVGLAVVKRIVELHHGEVDIVSKIGEGTTFFITLPIKPLDI